MSDANSSEVTWRKSSLSDGQNNCVEVAVLPRELIGLRDGKDPNGPVLVFSPSDWRTFVDGIKVGELDNPA